MESQRPLAIFINLYLDPFPCYIVLADSIINLSSQAVAGQEPVKYKKKIHIYVLDYKSMSLSFH